MSSPMHAAPVRGTSPGRVRPGGLRATFIGLCVSPGAATREPGPGYLAADGWRAGLCGLARPGPDLDLDLLHGRFLALVRTCSRRPCGLRRRRGQHRDMRSPGGDWRDVGYGAVGAREGAAAGGPGLLSPARFAPRALPP